MASTKTTPISRLSPFIEPVTGAVPAQIFPGATRVRQMPLTIGQTTLAVGAWPKPAAKRLGRGRPSNPGKVAVTAMLFAILELRCETPGAKREAEALDLERWLADTQPHVKGVSAGSVRRTGTTITRPRRGHRQDPGLKPLAEAFVELLRTTPPTEEGQIRSFAVSGHVGTVVRYKGQLWPLMAEIGPDGSGSVTADFSRTKV
jgi:hypothetical protein